MKLGTDQVPVDVSVRRKSCARRRKGGWHLDDVAVAGSKSVLQDLPDSVVFVAADVLLTLFSD